MSVNEQQTKPDLDWSRCIFCQELRDDPLTDPARNTKEDKQSGLTNLCKNLREFQKLGSIPCNVNFDALDSGDGLEANLTLKGAKYHKKCSLLFNNSRLQREQQKRSVENTLPINSTPLSTRSSSGLDSSTCGEEASCIFCQGPSRRGHPLSRLTSSGESTIRSLAITRNDTKVLVALHGWEGKKGVWYHKEHYALYLKEKKVKLDIDTTQDAHKNAFSSIIQHIHDEKGSKENAPAFEMPKLAELYKNKLQEQGVDVEVHSSRLKGKILEHFADLEALGTPGQKTMITFKEDLNTSVRVECASPGGDIDILNRAADILRRSIFNHSSVSWQEMTEEELHTSTPAFLKNFMRRLIDGPSASENDLAVSTICQLVIFNVRKKPTGLLRRHDARRETALPVYVGLKLYGTKSKELVSIFHELGMGLSYDRVKTILHERANNASAQYQQDGVVCPLSMELGVFTTACVDNLDHNTSSTLANSAFHGTAISLMQHGPPGTFRYLQQNLPLGD